MRETRITLPELALIAGTRAALGAGLGLLLADRLSDEQRKGVGWTLVAIGRPQYHPPGVRGPGRRPRVVRQRVDGRARKAPGPTGVSVSRGGSPATELSGRMSGDPGRKPRIAA